MNHNPSYLGHGLIKITNLQEEATQGLPGAKGMGCLPTCPVLAGSGIYG